MFVDSRNIDCSDICVRAHFSDWIFFGLPSYFTEYPQINVSQHHFDENTILWNKSIWTNSQQIFQRYRVSYPIRRYDCLMSLINLACRSIDGYLPKSLFGSMQNTLNLIGSALVIAVVNPIFLIPVLILSIFFIMFRRIYLETVRNAKRLESNSNWMEFLSNIKHFKIMSWQ